MKQSHFNIYRKQSFSDAEVFFKGKLFWDRETLRYIFYRGWTRIKSVSLKNLEVLGNLKLALNFAACNTSLLKAKPLILKHPGFCLLLNPSFLGQFLTSSEDVHVYVCMYTGVCVHTWVCVHIRTGYVYTHTYIYQNCPIFHSY